MIVLSADMFCRFEHLGDTVLSLVVTNLLLEMYPNLRVGPSTVRYSFLHTCQRRVLTMALRKSGL